MSVLEGEKVGDKFESGCATHAMCVEIGFRILTIVLFYYNDSLLWPSIMILYPDKRGQVIRWGEK